MDSLEHVSHPYPAGQLSPTKSNNSMEHLGGGVGVVGGGKRDSAYSSFSTSSGTPDYTLSKSNTASTENMFHKFNQWDSGGKQMSRNNQNLTEGTKQDERLVFSQMSGGVSGWEAQQAEETTSHRHSTSSRTSLGPVWHVPEKKKPTSSSSSSPPPPPPPPPPARSDSYAATKVHERGLLITQPEGTESQICGESRRSYNPSSKNDANNFHNLSNKTNTKQYNTSLASGDVRQAPPPQQRYHSDKSTFYSQPWAAATSVAKPQNVGGYYSSLQELPTNGSAPQHNQKRNMNPTPQAAESSGGPNRYYCVTTCQLSNPHPAKTSENQVQSGSEQTQVTKVKYHLQQQQLRSSQGKESNGYTKHHVTTTLETFVPKFNPDDKGRPGAQSAESQVISYTSCRVSEQQRRSLPPQQPQQQEQKRELPPELRHQLSHLSTRISPLETPMLHSLSLDASGQDARPGHTLDESVEGKAMRRSERFATTLRNEIQMRKARLQKSSSAATLPGDSDEDTDTWKPADESTPTSADGSFTNTYKVNLKEAQTRVLMATSFRRKDLEPVLLEHPSAEALAGFPSAAQMGKDGSESVTGKIGPSSGLVSRIGGRKRFQIERKVRSFSEPDKINEVGVKLDLSETRGSSLDQGRQAESAKPTSSTHISPHGYARNPMETKTSSPGANSQAQGLNKGVRGHMERAEQLQGGGVSHASKPSAQEQQRLGTFAEYEATWKTQEKKSETRGRYKSADDILDPAPEERSKAKCFHERSRSSPSADFYGQVN